MKRRLFSMLLLLSAMVLLLCGGCGQEAEAVKDAPGVITAEKAADAFNAALEKLETAGSYTMIGNVSSTAEVIPADGSDTQVVTLRFPLHTTFEDGRLQNLSVGGDNPHATYFDGIHYYISISTGSEPYLFRIPAERYADYADYAAADYLRPVDAEAVFSPSIAECADGGMELSFRIPCGLYDSPAVYGLLGELLDEDHTADELQLRLTVNADGYPTALYLFFGTTTSFADDSIRQELAASLTLSDFSVTVVTPPPNLDAYLPLDEMESSPDGNEFFEIPSEDLG